MTTAELAITPSYAPAKPFIQAETVQPLALATIDSTARVTTALEQGLTQSAHLVNSVVPATTRFIGSFFLPEIANNLVTRGTELITRTGTWLATCSAKAAFHSLTFGIPAWSQALRQGLAVSGATGQLHNAEESQELLARCFAESNQHSLVRESLLHYLDCRHALAEAKALGTAGESRAAEITRELQALEVSLKNYQDFAELQMILKAGEGYLQRERKRIDDLALTTADTVIARVEQYYKTHCGNLAGRVEGLWNPDNREQERLKLRDLIAGRLQRVFLAELNSDETAAEIAKITKDLHAAFGTYRASFKAAAATLLGVGCATGAVQEALSAAWTAGRDVLGSALEFGAGQAWDALTGLGHWAAEGWSNALSHLSSWVAGVVNDAIASNPVVQSIQSGIETISNLPETVTDYATEACHGAAASLSNDYSSNYWTGDSRTAFMGVEGGKVIFGESCISGQPGISRFDAQFLPPSLSESGITNPLPAAPAGAAIQAESLEELIQTLR